MTASSATISKRHHGDFIGNGLLFTNGAASIAAVTFNQMYSINLATLVLKRNRENRGRNDFSSLARYTIDSYLLYVLYDLILTISQTYCSTDTRFTYIS